MTAVEFLSEQIRLTNIEGLRFQLWDAIKQAKEMEKNSYICSKCKSQINGNEVMQQMQDSEKSD